MRAWWMVMALGLTAMVVSPAWAAPGRLEAARAEVRPKPPPPPPRRTSGVPPRATASGATVTRVYTRPAASPRRGPAGPTVVRYQVVRRTTVPAVAPPVAMGPSSEPPRLDKPPARPPFQRLLNRYPYEAREDGWVADPWDANYDEHRRIGGRLSAEGSYQYQGLWRTGFAARVGSPRVDVDTQLSFYVDTPARDAMYLGDTSLNFAPIALPQVVWRVGAGARYMVDGRLPATGQAREYAAGWNMTSSVDFFPGSPFVLSARIDRGTLYRTPVWRARGTVGLVRKRFELFAGYDHTQIGRAGRLGGPLLGLRAWL